MSSDKTTLYDAVANMALPSSSHFSYLDSLVALLKRRSVIIATSFVLVFGSVAWFKDIFGSGAFISPAAPRFGAVAGERIATFNGKWDYHRDQDNLLLDLGQCDAAFPDLFDEIKRPMKDRWSRRITLQEIDSIEPKNGYVRAMIFDQQVFNLCAHFKSNVAALHN